MQVTYSSKTRAQVNQLVDPAGVVFQVWTAADPDNLVCVVLTRAELLKLVQDVDDRAEVVAAEERYQAAKRRIPGM